MRGSRIEYIKALVDKYDSRFAMASHKTKKDYYFLTKDKKIVARIYLENNQWYIWYEDCKFRLRVKNFTEAKSMLEEEFSCVD